MTTEKTITLPELCAYYFCREDYTIEIVDEVNVCDNSFAGDDKEISNSEEESVVEFEFPGEITSATAKMIVLYEDCNTVQASEDTWKLELTGGKDLKSYSRFLIGNRTEENDREFQEDEEDHYGGNYAEEEEEEEEDGVKSATKSVNESQQSEFVIRETEDESMEQISYDGGAEGEEDEEEDVEEEEEEEECEERGDEEIKRKRAVRTEEEENEEDEEEDEENYEDEEEEEDTEREDEEEGEEEGWSIQSADSREVYVERELWNIVIEDYEEVPPCVDLAQGDDIDNIVIEECSEAPPLEQATEASDKSSIASLEEIGRKTKKMDYTYPSKSSGKFKKKKLPQNCNVSSKGGNSASSSSADLGYPIMKYARILKTNNENMSVVTSDVNENVPVLRIARRDLVPAKSLPSMGSETDNNVPVIKMARNIVREITDTIPGMSSDADDPSSSMRIQETLATGVTNIPTPNSSSNDENMSLKMRRYYIIRANAKYISNLNSDVDDSTRSMVSSISNVIQEPGEETDAICSDRESQCSPADDEEYRSRRSSTGNNLEEETEREEQSFLSAGGGHSTVEIKTEESMAYQGDDEDKSLDTKASTRSQTEGPGEQYFYSAEDSLSGCTKAPNKENTISLANEVSQEEEFTESYEKLPQKEEEKEEDSAVSKIFNENDVSKLREYYKNQIGQLLEGDFGIHYVGEMCITSTSLPQTQVFEEGNRTSDIPYDYNSSDEYQTIGSEETGTTSDSSAHSQKLRGGEQISEEVCDEVSQQVEECASSDSDEEILHFDNAQSVMDEENQLLLEGAMQSKKNEYETKFTVITEEDEFEHPEMKRQSQRKIYVGKVCDPILEVNEDGDGNEEDGGANTHHDETDDDYNDDDWTTTAEDEEDITRSERYLEMSKNLAGERLERSEAVTKLHVGSDSTFEGIGYYMGVSEDDDLCNLSLMEIEKRIDAMFTELSRIKFEIEIEKELWRRKCPTGYTQKPEMKTLFQNSFPEFQLHELSPGPGEQTAREGQVSLARKVKSLSALVTV